MHVMELYVTESVMESIMGVSSPCRHVMSVLTVLYNTDTYALFYVLLN